MKRLFKTAFVSTLLITLLSAGCSPEQSSSSSSTDASATDTDTGTDGNTDGGSTTQTSNNCSGTTSDGQGDGYPIHQFSMMLAGHQSWMPGTYSDSMAQETMPTLSEASIVFKSDSRLKVRLKVNNQAYPTAGETYCYGRATGQSSDAYPYTKIRFRVHLRDIMCDTPDPQNPNNCTTALYLGPRYRTQYIDPVSVDSCSPIIDLGTLRNSTQFGTTIEVEDVKSDSTCQSNSTFCPAEKIVRAASCWHMNLQVVTDFTQDFK
jgi:hypothetical protein